MARKNSSPCPQGDASVVTCIEPGLLLEEVLVSPLWIAAYFGGDAIPCWCHVDGFMELVVLDANEFTKLRKRNRWLKCQPSSYVRLAAYRFVGLCEGA